MSFWPINIRFLLHHSGSPRRSDLIAATRALVISVVLLLLFVTGCSKNESSSSTGPIPPEPFAVASTSPASGGSAIAPGGTITVTFNRPVDPATVTPSSFVVDNATGSRTVSGASVMFAPNPKFTPGVAYSVTITPTLTDMSGEGLTAEYSFSFSVATLPIADAGGDRAVSKGASVTLDGSGSSDPGGGTLTYTWTQVSGPSLGNLVGMQPSFTAPNEITSVAFDLVVSNGTVSSDPDRIAIVIAENGANAFFVSPHGDDANPGTLAAPKASIQAGINAAASSGGDVFVAAGTYPGSIQLADSVSLYGGFGADDWVRDLALSETTIDGGSYAVRGANVHQLVLEGFTIRSADATGSSNSSVGISLHNSLGITINQNLLEIGDGQTGSNGNDATDRTGKAPGGSSGDDAYFALTCSGAAGGAGGDVNYGRDGGYGGRSGGAGGGSVGWSGENGGGAGGAPGGFAGNGYPGSPGNPGAPGVGGDAGLNFGSIINGVYQASHGEAGESGKHGWGGGGGGGGGAGFACSASGGGGGAGGLNGLGGGNGGGGGGSIGIILSGGTEATITNNTVVTGGGGDGGSSGKGAKGQTGGSGASGGAGNANGGAGGRGGDGGKGGDGAHGGCGGGGPVIGILEANSSSVRENNAITLGVAGVGGARADGLGNEGANGDRAEFKKIL